MNRSADTQTPPDFSHLLAVGEVREAERLAVARLEKDTSDPEARAVLARLCLLDLDGEAAREHLALAAPSESPCMRLAQAGMAAIEGDDARAHQLFSEVLAADASAVEARFGVGISLARLGRLPEALVELRRAAGDVPESGQLRYHLGRCELEAGETEAAVASLGEAVKLDPFLPDAWVAFARVASLTGQAERAAEILEEGLRVLPGQMLLQTELANLRIVLGQAEEGLAGLQAVAEAAPDHPDAAANEALRRVALGEVSEAIEFCLTKREDGVWGASLARALADAYEAAKDPESALVAYAEASALDPSDWQAPNNMGLVLLSLGKSDQLPLAVEVLEQAHHRAPSQLEPLLNLALVYARMEHFETAIHLARHVASFELGAQHPVHDQAMRLLRALGGSMDGPSVPNSEPS